MIKEICRFIYRYFTRKDREAREQIDASLAALQLQGKMFTDNQDRWLPVMEKQDREIQEFVTLSVNKCLSLAKKNEKEGIDYLESQQPHLDRLIALRAQSIEMLLK